MNKHNEGHADSPEAGSPVSPTPAEGIDQRRRHFTRAGLVVSGAIMTLKSASVLAGKKGAFPGDPTNIQYQGCQSPSGFASMNVSAPGKTPPSCGGLSPGGWKNWPTFWPTGYDPGLCAEPTPNGCKNYVPNTGTPFHSDLNRAYPTYFPGFAGAVFGTKSLMEVMMLEGNADPARLGMHCAASILNVAKELVPTTVLTIPVILDMWLKTYNGGFYSPIPGVEWYSADVVAYLQSTFGEN
jgi:hypothetical protein